MSTLNGTDTSYFAFRDIHDRSNLPSAGWDHEFEFMSGTNEKNMLTWKQYMEYIMYGTQYPVNSQAENTVKKAIQKQERDKPCNTLHTVEDVIKADPRTTKIAKLLSDTNYKKLSNLYYPATFFAPIDENFDYYLGPYLESGVYSLNAFQTIRYHTLPYEVKPHQLNGRKYLLQSDLNEETFQSDWTNGKRQLLSQDTPYPGEITGWFPQFSWIVNILDIIECAGGVVYIIDRPMVFPAVL